MTDPFRGIGIRVDPESVRRAVRIARNVAIAGIALLIVVPWVGQFGMNWLWAREVGFEQVFLTSFAWRLGLFLVQGGLAFGFLYWNIRHAAPRTTTELTVFSAGFGAEPAIIGRFLPSALLIGAALVAWMIAATAAAGWLDYVMAWHGAPTGVTDPLLGRDVGFYLFRLDAISGALSAAILVTVLTALGVTGLYVLEGQLAVLRRSGASEPGASRHVAALVALAFLLTAARLWIVSRANLTASTTGPMVGASYSDVHAQLPAIVIATLVALAGAVTVVVMGWRGNLWRGALVTIGAYLAVTIVGRGVAPALMQRLVVTPNELDREAPYLQRHITATRRAWNLDSVDVRDLSGEAQLSMADIRANAATIGNIRLWERDLLGQTLSQLQEIRTYYDFVSVNDDRYVIDGKYRQVNVSARELNATTLPTRTFINERLTFTHGMGITVAPVNEVTPEGLPVLFVKDLPPVSTTSLTLTRPEIYYGELTNSYVFVHTAQREFDYPAGDANIYSRYGGAGGITLKSLLRRVLFAWQLGSMKLVLSSDISDSSRVLMRRNVHQRAQLALPFLDFDPETYLIVTDSGRLVWMLDAYTSSSRYPYAARVTGGVSYMRNSVKVAIDAYDGTVTAYLADSTDPVALAYQRIFPGVFTPMSQMPADLRRHLRYPNGLFRLQARLLGVYHMKEPDAFYHREDQWEIPGGAPQQGAASPYMRHIIMRLPGEKREEFIYMTPFTPRGKDNLAAWFVARMDGDQYGKLVVYRFPKQSLVYGPKQITNRIEQDTDISRQLSLWDQRGSRVIRGELLVIPIEESLIYVQPIFLQATGGSIPELKRVVVAHGGRVAMGETLDEGLQMVFGGTGGAVRPVAASATPDAAPTAAGTTVADLTRRAQDQYDQAMAAQRAGNWAEYGRLIDQLGATLRELRNRPGRP